METLISTAIGVVLGGLITIIAAKCYYEKASKQLTAESEKLRLLSGMILYKLQHPDAITETIFNKEDIVVGLKVQMKGTANGSSDVSGDLTAK